MALTVLSLAWPLAEVSLDAAGGAEQILALHDRALVQQGHRSVVVACQGSRVAGTLEAIPSAGGAIDGIARFHAQAAARAALHRVLQREHVDVVHLHGLDFDKYLPLPAPVLVTLHLPPSWYATGALRPRPSVTFACVSRAQQAQLPPGLQAVLLENGVPVDELRPARRKGSYALALGRVCAEKGFDLALDAAHAAGHSLLLAGRVYAYPEHQRYLREQVLPRLDRHRRYVGPVGLREKRWLLAHARCLLLTSRAPETSSLVAMEALACGTPVVALRTGAVPQIVEHGRTGLVIDAPQGLPRALGEVQHIEPAECRRAALERFSARDMTARALACYEALAAHARPESLHG